MEYVTGTVKQEVDAFMSIPAERIIYIGFTVGICYATADFVSEKAYTSQRYD
jgi:hypothetical protein